MADNKTSGSFESPDAGIVFAGQGWGDIASGINT